MSLPWFKFHPASWRGDQALRAVSVAARGLWIECLCIMHEAKPYGHLVLNGTAIGDDVLARMTGVPVDEVSALLAELRQAGVLSVTRDGVVVSRRMTRDFGLSQKGRKAAKRRWSQVPDAKGENDRPNGLANGFPTTKNEEDREPPRPPKGGERRRGHTRGAGVFLARAQEMENGTGGPQASIGSDRHDAGRFPVLAIDDR